MAELYGRWLTTMLAADTAFERGLHFASLGHSHAHQLSHTVLIEHGEGIMLEDPLVDVHRQELGYVVATVTKGHLCKVVDAKREEVGFGSDLVCRECRT